MKRTTIELVVTILGLGCMVLAFLGPLNPAFRYFLVFPMFAYVMAAIVMTKNHLSGTSAESEKERESQRLLAEADEHIRDIHEKSQALLVVHDGLYKELSDTRLMKERLVKMALDRLVRIGELENLVRLHGNYRDALEAKNERHERDLASAMATDRNLRANIRDLQSQLTRDARDHGIRIKGWFCMHCDIFNGEERQEHVHCRRCEKPKPTFKQISTALHGDV